MMITAIIKLVKMKREGESISNYLAEYLDLQQNTHFSNATFNQNKTKKRHTPKEIP